MKEKIQSPTLKASLRDGMYHAYTLGAGEAYLAAFGIYLGASAFEVGILAALPPLLGALAQALGVWLMERSSGRRTILVRGAALHAISWVPISCLALYPGPSHLAVGLLILLAIFYHVSTNLIAPVWNSLIGDLVPTASRGEFLGYRSRFCNLATFIALIVAGVVLHVSDHGVSGVKFVAIAYCAIFLSCAVSRALSSYWLSRHDDPEYKISLEHKFSFLSFILKIRKSNFAKFAIFFGAVNCAITVAGPFFAVYVLKDLRLSYLSFTAIVAASFLAQIVTLDHWGRLSDQFGNKKILNLCALGVALNPILWFFSPNAVALMVAQFIGGCAWAGFTLAATNFMFDAVSPPKRARCAAYVAMINGIFVFVGSMVGAYLIENIDHTFFAIPWLPVPDSRYLVLFALSALLRALAAALMVLLVREVRQVEPIRHHQLLFRIASLRPMSGATFALFTGRARGRIKKP